MKTLADELKEIAKNKAIELKKDQELKDSINKKEKQDKVDLILQKTYDYFESNWIKKAKETAFCGKTYFSVKLTEYDKESKYYDIYSECENITGVYLYELYEIINNNNINYFDTLCNQIEEQGFKNVKVICKRYSYTSIQLNTIISYDISLNADFNNKD